MLATKKVGPEFDKDWSYKVDRIICFGGVEKKVAHEALIKSEGDVQSAINSVVDTKPTEDPEPGVP